MFMVQASATWTLEQLHRLPDDGNRYELLNGALYVTPAPSPAHEVLAARLRALVEPYVKQHGLGEILGPRAVVRRVESEVEPDLMVVPALRTIPRRWEELPTPLLVVEVLSRTTRRRDVGAKRAHYLGIGVREYWMVDGPARCIHVASHVHGDRTARDQLLWQPSDAIETLAIDLPVYFASVLGASRSGGD